jgi:hypothetical protein
MKKITAKFLQAVATLIGLGAFVFLLWEPHLEGRNAHATLFEIYFKDAFLAYAYAASIPFFTALYQAFKALGYAGQGKASSPESLKALRTIKYCAILFACLIAAPVAYLFIVRPGDDIAGGVAMGLFLIILSATMAAVAARFERSLQRRE